MNGSNDPGGDDRGDATASWSFSIRRATAADADAFTHDRLAVFREMHGMATPEATTRLEAMTRTAFGSLVGGRSTFAWLATAAGDLVVGSAALHTFERFPSLQNPSSVEGYVSHVYVAPSWRRRGVGSALVTSAVAMARELGLHRVRLHATEPGRALYETLGFALRSNDMDICL